MRFKEPILPCKKLLQNGQPAIGQRRISQTLTFTLTWACATAAYQDSEQFNKISFYSGFGQEFQTYYHS